MAGHPIGRPYKSNFQGRLTPSTAPENGEGRVVRWAAPANLQGRLISTVPRAIYGWIFGPPLKKIEMFLEIFSVVVKPTNIT